MASNYWCHSRGHRSPDHICILLVQCICHSCRTCRSVCNGCRRNFYRIQLQSKANRLMERWRIGGRGKRSSQLTTTFQNDSLFLQRLRFVDGTEFDFVADTSWRNAKTPIANLFLIRLLLGDNHLYVITADRWMSEWIYHQLIERRWTDSTYYSFRLHMFAPSSSASPNDVLAKIVKNANDR